MTVVEAGIRSDQSTPLDAFRRGEADAVRALYREYGRLVYAVAYQMVGRHDLAEEATKQTFVDARRAAEDVDSRRELAAWLTSIARRAAIDVSRAMSRRAPARAEVTWNERADVRRLPDLETHDAGWPLRRAIAALPTREATIVRMQHVDGMTHVEIFEKLGVTLGSVQSTSERAHRQLATLLGHLRERR